MTARRDSDLLAQIERDVLDESKPVATALRKCLALGGHAKSAELREWASRELHGYPDEAPLPEYRKIRTPLLMDAFAQGGIFRGKQVSVIDLPKEARDVVGDELPLTFGTGKIEALIRQAENDGGSIKLGPPAAAELALMMTHEVGRYRVERVYWSAGTGVLCGVIDAIRTTLTELVAEIRVGTAAENGTPSPETVGQAVQFAVYGKGNRITVATAGAGGTATATSAGEEPEETRFWTWRRTGAAIVGLATIAGGVAAILALHPF
jgi:AbiTii